MGSLSESYIFHLKQPCENRGVELINNGDGTVTINGKRFQTMQETEDYLMSIQRKDIG